MLCNHDTQKSSSNKKNTMTFKYMMNVYEQTMNIIRIKPAGNQHCRLWLIATLWQPVYIYKLDSDYLQIFAKTNTDNDFYFYNILATVMESFLCVFFYPFPKFQSVNNCIRLTCLTQLLTFIIAFCISNNLPVSSFIFSHGFVHYCSERIL